MTTSGILAAAAVQRGIGDWAAALLLYGQAAAHLPDDPAIAHNLALCQYGLGDDLAALGHVGDALRQSPQLWQGHALAALSHRRRGDCAAAANSCRAVLAIDPANASALLGLADLSLNEYGDARAAIAFVAPLAKHPVHRRDADLTMLMASLYDRGSLDAAQLSKRLAHFSHSSLRLPELPRRAASARPRRRVAVLSPLLAATPVYFLGFSVLAALRSSCDLLFFDRGTKRDWATARFEAIATEWHAVAALDAEALAARLAAADIDVLIDCGGWSDPVGLRALSARPARTQWKWVGGQSATTGLTTFDAWLGDQWQNPPELDRLYSEPVVRLGGGYVDYTPPDYLAAIGAGARRQSGVVLAGNPVKIGAAMLAHWPKGVDRVTLLDRRYGYAATRDRVTELLARGGVHVDAVIVPHGHAEYLHALARFAAIVDTRPYATGLTAVEAAALGVGVIAPGPAGQLFSERHQLSHARTGGRNATLAARIANMVALA